LGPLGTVLDFVTLAIFSGDPFAGILVQLSQGVQFDITEFDQLRNFPIGKSGQFLQSNQQFSLQLLPDQRSIIQLFELYPAESGVKS
jgi:hypothetical protein